MYLNFIAMIYSNSINHDKFQYFIKFYYDIFQHDTLKQKKTPKIFNKKINFQYYKKIFNVLLVIEIQR